MKQLNPRRATQSERTQHGYRAESQEIAEQHQIGSKQPIQSNKCKACIVIGLQPGEEHQPPFAVRAPKQLEENHTDRIWHNTSAKQMPGPVCVSWEPSIQRGCKVMKVASTGCSETFARAGGSRSEKSISCILIYFLF